MKILIDGYNLIFAWGWMPTTQSPQAAETARAKLLQKLAQMVPVSLRGRVTVVFDVKASSVSKSASQLESGIDRSGFQIRFAHDYPDADTLIEELIRKEFAPQHLVVVSTDQRLRTAAQRRRAISIRSQDFLDKIQDIVAQCSSAQPSPAGDLPNAGPTGTGSASPVADTKQAAISSLKEVDWLAEFGIDPVEIHAPSETVKATEDRPQEVDLDELVDIRLKKQKRK
jgi:uncharacterized protein